MVEEVCTDFFEIYTLCLKSDDFRAAKRARNKILTDFIRLDAHVAKAGLKIKGFRPLDNPQRVFSTINIRFHFSSING
jgi:hypothetical protein